MSFFIVLLNMSIRNLPNFLIGSSGGGTGSAGVEQIIAGTNITIDPPDGLGVVTINSTAVAPTPSREAFCATLEADFSAGADGYNALFPLTTTPDTTTWPSISGETIFNNLTVGSFDNSTGVFTCGIGGDYVLTTKFVVNDLAFPWDGVGLSLVDLSISVGVLALNIADNLPGAQIVSLVAGRDYQLSLWIDSTDPPPYAVPKSNSVLNIDWPRFLWGMSLVAPGASSGGTPARLTMAVIQDTLFTGDGAEIHGVWDVGLTEPQLSNISPNALGVTPGFTWAPDGTFSVPANGTYIIDFAYTSDASYSGYFFAACICVTDSNVMATSPATAGESIGFVSVVDMVAGKVYQVIFNNSQDETFTVPFITLIPQADAPSPQFTTYPAFLFSCVAISGGSGGGGGGVESVVDGTGITVDNTDPANPIVNNVGVLSVTAGTNVTVDNTDPQNPIVSSSGGGASEGFRAEMTADNNAQASGAILATNWTVGNPNCFNTGGMFNTTTGVFTCPTTGLWLFSITVEMAANVGVKVAGLALNVNGNDRMVYDTGTFPVGQYSCPISGIVQMTAAQQAWLTATSADGTTTVTVNSSNFLGSTTWFSACRIG